MQISVAFHDSFFLTFKISPQKLPFYCNDFTIQLETTLNFHILYFSIIKKLLIMDGEGYQTLEKDVEDQELLREDFVFTTPNQWDYDSELNPIELQ